MLRLMPVLTLALLLGPVIAGLAGTLLPAFGYLPALGGGEAGLWPWRSLLETPGLATSVRLSLTVGLFTTVVSLGIVFVFCAAAHATRLFTLMQRLLSPLLSVPHVTVAFGLAFLFAPSGWLLRALSPWATGFTRPPDVILLQDPDGIALALGLIAKEVPFLLLVTLAALGQVDAHRVITVARTLGYGVVTGWLKAVAPRVYAQIRLPVLAVLAYSTSVVDVALVLGPSAPPTLAVQLLRWFNDPELSMRYVAAAGALLQLAVVLVAMATWLLTERLLAIAWRGWLRGGFRGVRDGPVRVLALLPVGGLSLAVLLGLVALGLWSLSGAWRFPDFLPTGLTLAVWARHADDLLRAGGVTLVVGAGSALLAVALSIGCLELEARRGRVAGARALWLLYTPLLVPQIAFLFGVQVLLVATDIDATWTAVIWSHLVFVLPYVFLSLSDPYRALDPRYTRTALCLGASADRVFWRLKLPMLLRPMLIALAVGFAVSVGQYLPTLFAGAGRFATLTTEAVSLSAGGDRRVIGVYAALQLALPALVYALALGVPAWLYRHRRGMQVGR